MKSKFLSCIVLLILTLGHSELKAQNNNDSKLPTIARKNHRMKIIDDELRFTGNSDSLPKIKYSAFRGSYFKIIAVNDSNSYVRFTKLGPRLSSSNSIPPTVVTHKTFVVGNKYINEATVQFRRGLYASMLMIPFKYRLERSDSIDSELALDVSIGTALGYTIAFPSTIQITPIAFLGMSLMSVREVDPEESGNLMGITYGAGLDFALTREFQIGLVFGRDHLAGSIGRDWPFQDKWWVSASIGFMFLEL